MESRMYRISVVYSQRPGKAMRAISFFNRHPTLMGKPMLANSVFLVDEVALFASQVELERYERDGIIEIKDSKGVPFKFPRDTTYDPGIVSEEDLAMKELAKVQAALALGAAAGPNEKDPELPPPLEETPQQATAANDSFFDAVREHADKIRPRRKKRAKAAEG